MLGKILGLSNFVGHCGIKAILWTIAVGGALFPAIYAAGADAFDWPGDLARAVNKAGLFRDFFYVVIIIALLGLSNIFYCLLTTEGRTNIWVAVVFLGCSAYYLYLLVFGTGHFARLYEQHETPLNEVAFNHDLITIWSAFGVGLLTEFTVLFRER